MVVCVKEGVTRGVFIIKGHEVHQLHTMQVVSTVGTKIQSVYQRKEYVDQFLSDEQNFLKSRGCQ